MTRKRSYRELQADARSEVDHALERLHGPHHCPSCGHAWTGSSTPPASPPGFPVRDEPALIARAHGLEPTATRLAAALRDALPETLFDVWIAPAVLADSAGDRLLLLAPDHIADWASDRFARVLDRCATDLAGRPLHVTITPGLTQRLADATRSLGSLLSKEEQP
ncbi:MAG: hypothetical protein WKF96_00265 [Solirubrobacteraceae bacterium]